MEPVASTASPLPRRLGGQAAQCRGGWRVWARRAVTVALLLVVTGVFAGAAYRARRTPRDLAFVLVSYYLLALLLCCVAKLEQLRRDPAAGAGVAERRRVRFGVWAVSVALANTFASRVAGAMPSLALKLAVWGVTAVVLGLGFYFIFSSNDAECGGVEHGGHGRAFHELRPGENV